MRRPGPHSFGIVAIAAGLWLGVCGVAWGQHWPTEPVAFAGGRVLVAGDASVTYGSEDPGWFTYTNYETSAIRRLRAGVTVEARATKRIAFLAEIRAETGVGVTPYAWYIRVSPLDSGLLDIQAGRVPPVFGAFSRRSYPQDNPLIGSPQTYQYLTTVRPDAIPATAVELLESKGSGWLVDYSVGNPEPHNGVPVVAAERWDTGVQVRIGPPAFEAAVAYTAGTLSSPKVNDDNRGRQVSGRLAWRPTPAFSVGASAASGTFVSDEVRQARPDAPPGSDDQRAFGVDAEASWGRWLIRGEFVVNDWRVPPLDPPQIVDPLRSRSGYVEARIRLLPRLYVAVRGDRISFASIESGSGTDAWEADVSRVEYGAGFTIRRGLLLKASVLSNWRDGGRVRQSNLGAVQVLAWF
jgi:hypothetical protein